MKGFSVSSKLLVFFWLLFSISLFAKSWFGELDLSGDSWQFEGIRPGQGVKEELHKYFGEVCPVTFNWNGATVPGDVYTDLWHAGQIPDPLFGRNAMLAKWAMEMEWWYLRKFAIDPEWKGRYIRVIFEGVDYSFDAWINGVYLGHHEGMFSKFEVSVQEYLRFSNDPRANGLVIKLDPPPRNYRLTAGRKFPWHGDYWRPIVPMGIWKKVILKSSGPVCLEDVYVQTRKIDYEKNIAELSFEITLCAFEKLNQEVTLNLQIEGINFKMNPINKNKRINLNGLDKQTIKINVTIPNVRLWYPWDIGKPNRYQATVKLFSKESDLWDEFKIKFGVREVKLEWNPGFSKEEVKHPWVFIINGKRTFIRSASWGGPPSIFYGRIKRGDYLELIKLARGANLNNLRIFGWHPTEIEQFYDICDSLGITVWQDLLPIASVYMPEDEQFLKETLQEAEACLKEIRNHPSLIMLEGGEETFYGIYGLANNYNILKRIGQLVEKHSQIPYRLTSPMDRPAAIQKLGIGGKKESSHPHELHYGLGEELLEEYVGKWDFAVIPEFAAVSVPNLESLRKFIPTEELWPPGPSWGYHWAELDAMVANIYQILGEKSFNSLTEFIKASQITQGEIFKWGIEYIRRKKYHSSAISICHFNTYAPDMKWGIVDYYHVPKISYELVKMAYQPLLVSLFSQKRWWKPNEEVSMEIWFVNDLHKDFNNCKLDLEVKKENGKKIVHKVFQGITIPSDSSMIYRVFRFRNPIKNKYENFFVKARLTNEKGSCISYNKLRLITGDINKIRSDCKKISIYLKEIRGDRPLADYRRFEKFNINIVESLLDE